MVGPPVPLGGAGGNEEQDQADDDSPLSKMINFLFAFHCRFTSLFVLGCFELNFWKN